MHGFVLPRNDEFPADDAFSDIHGQPIIPCRQAADVEIKSIRRGGLTYSTYIVSYDVVYVKGIQGFLGNHGLVKNDVYVITGGIWTERDGRHGQIVYARVVLEDANIVTKSEGINCWKAEYRTRYLEPTRPEPAFYTHARDIVGGISQ